MTEAARSTYDLRCTVLATAAGLAIGWLDLHTTEVIVVVVPLLAAGILLGVLRPKAAWRWAVLIALGVPMMEVLAKLTGMHTAEPVHLDVRIWFVVLGFALLGSYMGVLVRRVAGAAARSA